MPLLRFGYSAFSWANAKFFRRNGVIFWATPLFLKPYRQGVFAYKTSTLANAVVGNWNSFREKEIAALAALAAYFPIKNGDMNRRR